MKKLRIILALSSPIPIAYAYKKYQKKIRLRDSKEIMEVKPSARWSPPSRDTAIKNLKSTNFDVIVIGGGATGTGCALDAATRGLKTACIEMNDFSSGTSSKSTKLIHGGVRYLENAVLGLNWEEFTMVYEALAERFTFLKIAPHLTTEMPIMLPVYSRIKLPYFYAGVKAYDILALDMGIKRSFLLNKEQVLDEFPLINTKNLVGGIVYYDGQQNDSRMNVSLAVTAALHGATVVNYCELTGLVKDEKQKIIGVEVRNRLTNEKFVVKGTAVINATGPFADSVMMMDDKSHEKIVEVSSGVHVVFPKYLSPKKMGLLDPKTSDGRVLFCIPWRNVTLAGTTEGKGEPTFNPEPKAEDIQYIVDEFSTYLHPDVKLDKTDVLSAWSGQRPLIRDVTKKDTKSLIRNYLIIPSTSGLTSIVGGKWTTYRAMAERTIDSVIQRFNLPAKRGCCTENTFVVGSHEFSKGMSEEISTKYHVPKDIASHLVELYGDRSGEILSSIQEIKDWDKRRITTELPITEDEIRYCIRNEFAVKISDVIARRIGLTFVNCNKAFQLIEPVAAIMKKELMWSDSTMKNEIEEARQYMKSMGHTIIDRSKAKPLDLNAIKEIIDNSCKEKDKTMTAMELRSLLKSNNGPVGFFGSLLEKRDFKCSEVYRVFEQENQK